MKRVFKYIFLIITIILFTSTKVRAEDKWIGECHYAINDPSTGAVAYTVDIFFNDQKLSPQVSTGGGFIDFELNDILNYYRKYSACPIKLYIHENYLLNFDLANNRGYYDRTDQKFYPENDSYITEKDEYYSQCYYSLSTGGGGAEYTSSDLININFNNEGYNVQVVDSNLKVKKGKSLTMVGGDKVSFKGWDIALSDLQDYYIKNSSGCPTAIGWDKKDILFLLNNPGDHKQKKGYEVSLYEEKSSSKNQDVNLDGSDVGIDPTLPEITDCEHLLGNPNTPGSPAYYLLIAFHVIKYVALVLMIVLSVMDFTGAVAKQDKDAMAKILKKIMMRFILCIIIFLLPYFIKLLLNYLVERETDLCGIK